MRIANLKNEHIRNELLILIKEFAYRRAQVTLSSGLKSDFYIDCKQVSFRPDGASALGHLFFEAMELIESEQSASFDACAGMALGSVPLSISLSLNAFAQSRDLPSLCVRKEKKEHGTSSKIEGFIGIKKDASILLLEDVITTGQSTIKAAETFREAGYRVKHVLAIVDRQAGGEDNLREHGLTTQTLFDISDFGDPS